MNPNVKSYQLDVLDCNNLEKVFFEYDVVLGKSQDQVIYV